MVRTPPTRPDHVHVMWLVFGAMVVYELHQVARHKDSGGPLTNHVRWMYGTPGTARWWLLGGICTGVLTWAPPHFLFQGYDRRALTRHITTGVAIGAIGALTERRRRTH